MNASALATVSDIDDVFLREELKCSDEDIAAIHKIAEAKKGSLHAAAFEWQHRNDPPGKPTIDGAFLQSIGYPSETEAYLNARYSPDMTVLERLKGTIAIIEIQVSDGGGISPTMLRELNLIAYDLELGAKVR